MKVQRFLKGTIIKFTCGPEEYIGTIGMILSFAAADIQKHHWYNIMTFDGQVDQYTSLWFEKL